VERDLPTGTVTFLFTDIEGSTTVLDELGAETYADALAEHRRIIRETSSRNGGVEVDTQGDSFFLAFRTAPAALEAAIEAQRALASGPIQVRMGIHTGTPHVAAEGYVGIDVHRAARIAAVAHGGQVVVSSATAELVDPARLRDLGEHRLKDLTRSQQLHQLIGDGLASDFPPLRTLDRRTSNLPVQAAPLVGREREVTETRGLLSRARILTLTGPGGVGKTRLAIQLAADMFDEYEDGVSFVDLADVSDIALVVPAVAQSLGLQERGGRELSETLIDYLRDREVLLVLDNVERVVEAAPELSRWLAAAPRAKVISTSRIPLRLAGEQEYPVAPLPSDAAVELFVERARAVRPDFALDGDFATVAEICARLDDLPLAIELAAARVKLLAPSKLLERLEERLSILTGGARDAPERHRTLRAAIDWSFGLLDPDEQRSFARLSVFAGGFTLEAGEAVCDASLESVASLVEKSLLTQRQGTGGDPRFTLLETVREYAREQLEQRGEADTMAARHADYFLALVEGIAHGPDQLRSAPGSEMDNLRSARERLQTTDIELELRFATAAFWSLWTQASLHELKAWLDEALEHSAGVEAPLRARAFGALALATNNIGEIELARENARASLELARELGDQRQIEWALRVLSFNEPDLAERRRRLQECERICRELGNENGLAWVLYNLSILAFDEADLDEAEESVERAASIFRSRGRQWEAAMMDLWLATVLIEAKRPKQAEAIAQQVLETGTEIDSVTLLAESFVVLGSLRVERDPVGATQLLRAAGALADQAGRPLDPQYTVRFAQASLDAAQTKLGDRFERELETGAALSLEAAIELARSSA
jgi:predicted ATPase/class 3 adenylate cyclase